MIEIDAGSLAEKKTTVSKKTRKIETRVQRQVVLKDGEVIADTGPQIISRTLDDSHCEDVESGQNEASLPQSPELLCLPGIADDNVVRCSSRTRTTRRSAGKEVNHYHDESRREITDALELQKGLETPQHLLEKIENEFPVEVKGDLTFYSNKSKEYVTKERVNEVSKLDANGNIKTESTHTCLEQETTDDEIPEEFASLHLPQLVTGNTLAFQKSEEGAHIVPVAREPFPHLETRTASQPVQLPGSKFCSILLSIESNLIDQTPCVQQHKVKFPPGAGKTESSTSWQVDRKARNDGSDELWVKRKERGSDIWMNQSSKCPVQPQTPLPKFMQNEVTQSRFLQKAEIRRVSRL